jgi:hypothetical protein
MTRLRVLVHPVGYGVCGQLFGATTIAGLQLAGRSAQLLLDAARVFLAEGIEPATSIAMRHVGAKHDALRTTVGAAARLTVAEAANGSAVFRPYRSWGCLQTSQQ